ncbi:MAG: thioredoxin family protein [Gammaproteobacteria bacterium]|nr:thioredoxin family protein [Gammaproteobacteria bacterium]
MNLDKVNISQIQYVMEEIDSMQPPNNADRKWCTIAWFTCMALCALLQPVLAESVESGAASTPESGMHFHHGTFEEALSLAKDQDKRVFVDVYTIWCGPCVVMQETVFREPKVGEYFNARFVNYKLDAEDESQNGPELAARYDIGVYPTYLILDSEGTELSRASGSMSGEGFVSMISQLLGESSSSFEQLQERFANGERSPEFVQQYLLDAMVELGLRPSPDNTLEGTQAYFGEFEKYQAIAEEYFAERTYPKLINETDVQLVMYYLERVPRGHEVVDFVFDNYDAVRAVSSDAAISQFVLNATLGAVAQAAQAGDVKFVSYIEALYEEPLLYAVEFERNRYPRSGLLPENMKSNWEIRYLVASAEWDELLRVYQSRIESRGDAASARLYSSAARDLSLSEDPAHREMAVEYGKNAFELESKDPLVAVSYLSALRAIERDEELMQVAETYRSGLSDSAADKDRLALFDRIAAGWLTEEPDEAQSDQPDG